MTTEIQETQTMQEQLSELVRAMLQDGYDFKETPPIFVWQYEEFPNIEFKLLIKDVSEETLQ